MISLHGTEIFIFLTQVIPEQEAIQSQRSQALDKCRPLLLKESNIDITNDLIYIVLIIHLPVKNLDLSGGCFQLNGIYEKFIVQ